LKTCYATVASAEREAIVPGRQGPQATGHGQGHSLGDTSTALPNTSFEARPNGKPPSPGPRYAVHYLWPGLGVLPSVPPQLER